MIHTQHAWLHSMHASMEMQAALGGRRATSCRRYLQARPGGCVGSICEGSSSSIAQQRASAAVAQLQAWLLPISLLSCTPCHTVRRGAVDVEALHSADVPTYGTLEGRLSVCIDSPCRVQGEQAAVRAFKQARTARQARDGVRQYLLPRDDGLLWSSCEGEPSASRSDCSAACMTSHTSAAAQILLQSKSVVRMQLM